MTKDKKVIQVGIDSDIYSQEPVNTVLPRQRVRGKRVQVFFNEPSLTQQSFKDECDISTILDKWQKHGVIEHQNTYHGDYGDYLNVQDYHTSLNQILDAQEMFMSLPSSLRARFSNDPAEFLGFVGDPANTEECVKLGLKVVDVSNSDHQNSDSDGAKAPVASA